MASSPLGTPLSAIFSRRQVLAGALAASTASLLPKGAGAAGANPSSFTFTQAQGDLGESHRVAPGYRAQVLIRWGDKVLPDAPAFDPRNQTADAQERQFGYNNDFLAFLPLPVGSTTSDHGLLCANFEYSDAGMMFPAGETLTAGQVAVEMAAHGHGVVEIRKGATGWAVVENSPFARRITLASTPMALSGPAAGHPRLRTSADPEGLRVIGTLNNCSGGVTPWGTVLIAEENFDNYFGGDPSKTPEAANHARLGIKGKGRFQWARFHDRFHVEKEPNEPNRFGWIVEVDPYDPTSVPVKRTALGRFKHEAANCTLLEDGRVVVYSGDDEVFEYLYRFVSQGRFDPRDRRANFGLLDEGTLSVARFAEDGTMGWLPLVFGQGPLTPANGFHSQADVVIEARRAAALMGATPMDRPEDVEVNPVNGRIYVMLTNNAKRKEGRAGGANPRAPNHHGHVLELIPPGDGPGRRARHDAETMRWEILLLAGRPEDGARYHPATAEHGTWLSSPDNCAFDNRGRLWIATDRASKQESTGTADGLYACDVAGPGRALPRLFFACPRGAEMCGPAFTPDNRTLFLAVQHPGEGSSFATPSTRWPDFQPDMPPRPSVVAITREDGGEIGG